MKFGMTRYGPFAPEAVQFGKYETLTRTGTPTRSTVKVRSVLFSEMLDTFTGSIALRAPIPDVVTPTPHVRVRVWQSTFFSSAVRSLSRFASMAAHRASLGLTTLAPNRVQSFGPLHAIVAG